MVQTRYRKSEEIQARILDAAEELFANKGFESTSVREITGAAGVRGASVNYYFSSKRDLAVEVIRRRFGALTALREERLAAVDLSAGSREERTEHVVAAFVVPLADLTRAGGAGWANYNRIIAQFAVQKEYPLDAMTERVDKTALKFISALATIFPERSQGEAVQAFRFMLGAVVVAICESDRFDRLGSSKDPAPDVMDEPNKLVRFLSAGVASLLAPNGPNP